MLRQSKTVWSVAFASVISFMGIGLVDPILKPIANQLGLHPVPPGPGGTADRLHLLRLGTAARPDLGVRRPVIQRKVGTLTAICGAVFGFAVTLAAMAVGTDDKTVLVVGVVLSGAFLGVNNTLITETVMKISPVERGVALTDYSFVRFGGGAVAPWLAGVLGEKWIHLPFWVGSGAVVLAVVVLLTAKNIPRTLDAEPTHGAEPVASKAEAEALSVGDACVAFTNPRRRSPPAAHRVTVNLPGCSRWWLTVTRCVRALPG